jgi:hypothetical protein
MSNKKLKSFLIVLFAFLIFFVFWGYFLFNLSFSNSINYSFAEEATSTSEITTSTNTSTTDVAVSTTTISTTTTSTAMDIITSTTTSTIPIENENIENITTTVTSSLQKTTSTPVSLDSQIVNEDKQVEEDTSEEIIQPQEPLQPSQPITKERKLNKEIKIKKDAQYFCKAKSFYIDISNINNERIFEIEFEGKKPKNGVLEIGSLPLGIDITFLNKADYEWNISQGENIAVLQIIKQEFSQKGNFNIPIIYTDKDSRESVICQINIINF